MHLPDWMQDWLEILIPGIQIFLIILVAWLINWLIKRIISRAGKAYDLPHELLMPLRGVFRWIIIAAAVLAILERLGMSATVLWTAFTGFATVGAVAFFAAWSVLSNLFCALLIVTVGPFRLGDYIEVLDTAEKPGAKGRVIDLNMLYITLQDDSAPAGMPNLLQIPNS
jgi:small-conductance mechanosensitive channel